MIVVWLSLGAAFAAVAFGVHSKPFLLAEGFWIGGMLVGYRRLAPQIDRWDRGATGEETVGRAIEAMHAQGWRAIHDVCFGKSNIDHVLIGPAGIFTVETKSHRGRIPVERIDERMLRQAYAERKKLEQITQRHVEPLLVFSRAYLIGRVPCRRRGVMVLPARMLAGHLARRKAVYSAGEIASLHRRLLDAIAAARG